MFGPQLLIVPCYGKYKKQATVKYKQQTEREYIYVELRECINLQIARQHQFFQRSHQCIHKWTVRCRKNKVCVYVKCHAEGDRFQVKICFIPICQVFRRMLFISIKYI